MADDDPEPLTRERLDELFKMSREECDEAWPRIIYPPGLYERVIEAQRRGLNEFASAVPETGEDSRVRDSGRREVDDLAESGRMVVEDEE